MDEKNQYENWKDEVLNSLDGMQRAKPKADLFAKIEAQVYDSELKIVPKSQFRLAVAATITLLIVNFSLAMNYTKSNGTNANSTNQEMTSDKLISNYNLYE
ncbi:MAG: hypothetical protein ACI85I_000375 [Arenicella sp.]|jgi:hypothetical protein